jgi:hypothetical protein
MPPITPEAFERALRRADQSAVERLARTVVGDATATVAVVGASARTLPDSQVATPPDVVVVRGDASERLRTAAADRDVDLLDAGDLRERLLYDLPRDRADERCESTLGRPLRRDGTDDPDYAVPPSPVRRGDGVDPPGVDGSEEPEAAASPSVSTSPSGAVPVGPRVAAGAGFAVGLAAAVIVAVAVGGGIVGGLAPVPDPGPGADASSGASIGTPPGSETDGTADPPDDPDADAGPVATDGPVSTVAPVGARAPTNASESSVAEPRYHRLRPTCERPPSMVVAAQVGALRNNDADDSGVRTVFAFASPQNRQYTGPFSEFKQIVLSSTYEPLVNHTRADYAPPVVSGETATQRVTVSDDDGSRFAFEFTLSRQDDGPFEGCWMTDGVAPAALPEESSGDSNISN